MREAEKTQIVTSLRVDPKLWKEAKLEAIKHDMTLTEVIDEALKKWIHERAKE
jgi:predicted HicB family RNase H-like nuclease